MLFLLSRLAPGLHVWWRSAAGPGSTADASADSSAAATSPRCATKLLNQVERFPSRWFPLCDACMDRLVMPMGLGSIDSRIKEFFSGFGWVECCPCWFWVFFIIIRFEVPRKDAALLPAIAKQRTKIDRSTCDDVLS